jgi:hypothetical protein
MRANPSKATTYFHRSIYIDRLKPKKSQPRSVGVWNPERSTFAWAESGGNWAPARRSPSRRARPTHSGTRVGGRFACSTCTAPPWVGRCGLHFLRWWEWSQCHEPHVARAAAAWLCRRHTEVSLRELSGWPRVRSNPPGYSERMNSSTVTTIVAGFTRKGDRRRGRDGLLRSSISTVLFSSAATAER